jgi:hypothetical protein
MSDIKLFRIGSGTAEGLATSEKVAGERRR